MFSLPNAKGKYIKHDITKHTACVLHLILKFQIRTQIINLTKDKLKLSFNHLTQSKMTTLSAT